MNFKQDISNFLFPNKRNIFLLTDRIKMTEKIKQINLLSLSFSFSLSLPNLYILPHNFNFFNYEIIILRLVENSNSLSLFPIAKLSTAVKKNKINNGKHLEKNLKSNKIHRYFLLDRKKLARHLHETTTVHLDKKEMKAPLRTIIKQIRFPKKKE